MLTLDSLNSLTRGERAALALPKVAYISKENIELAKSQTDVSNPLLVNIRPPQSAIATYQILAMGELHVLMSTDLIIMMKLQ